jgi:ATP-dependent RNA helicase DeaD
MSNDTDNTATTVSEEESEARQAFAALGLGDAALRAVLALGYAVPTEIQAQTIPALLAGRDVMAQAPTGTGKTAAYGLPLVERLEEGDLSTQALVVLPTRELAMQVAEALHEMGKFREMVTLPIYGGAPYDRQLRALKRGVQVVVGTPGRLLDHLGRSTLDLSTVRTVVLDEADEMLNMGFLEDIEAILAQLPEQHQTALFSATLPPRIRTLAGKYLHDPVKVHVAARDTEAPLVRQVYYEVPGHAKPEALARILDLEEPESAIIFVRTRRDADTLAERLNGMGYIAQPIHGEINQSQRERALARFRAGNTQLLVATDVAARGLDIPDVSHVINYDLPMDVESYVHRIGRTGRAGAKGEALTLVTPRERRGLILIEKAIHRRLERLRLPSAVDVAIRQRTAFRDEVLRLLDAGQLDPFVSLVEDLTGAHDPIELAAAAFKIAVQEREARRPGRGISWVMSPEELAAAQVAEQPEEPLATATHPAGAKAPAAGKRTRERTPRQPMARLFLRVGKYDNVRPADIVGAIANEANVPGDIVGDIDLYDNFSFVEVPVTMADDVLAALNRTTIRGRAPHATLARPEEGGDGQRDPDRRREDRYGKRPGRLGRAPTAPPRRGPSSRGPLTRGPATRGPKDRRRG